MSDLLIPNYTSLPYPGDEVVEKTIKRWKEEIFKRRTEIATIQATISELENMRKSDHERLYREWIISSIKENIEKHTNAPHIIKLWDEAALEEIEDPSIATERLEQLAEYRDVDLKAYQG